MDDKWVLIVLAQPLITPIIKRLEHKVKAQLVDRDCYFLRLIYCSCLCRVMMFIISMVILTIGEIFMWPAVPTIANKLLQKEEKGFIKE